MPYFSSFPQIYYNLDNTKRETLVRDILHQLQLKRGLLNSGGVFYTYEVKEGERPEDIAHKLYGDATLHWVILIMNDIVNPFFDWALASDDLDRLIQKKYPGYTVRGEKDVFIIDLENSTIDGTFDGSNVIIQTTSGANADVLFYEAANTRLYCRRNSGAFDVTNKITQTQVRGTETYVVNATSELSYYAQGGFTVNTTSPVYVHQIGSQSTGNVIAWSAENQQLTVSITSGPRFNKSNPINQIGSNATMLMLDGNLSYESTHHYENSDGNVVSRGYSNTITAVGKDYDIGTTEIQSTVSSAWANPGIKGPVTNATYERTQNEARRNINLLKPEYIDQFVEEFESRMSRI